MNLVDSFIVATAFSYFGAVVLPIQFEKKMSQFAQKSMYLIMGVVLLLPLAFPGSNILLLWGFLGILYSVLAVYCFGGGQDWGSMGHNLFMTTWDLIIAICCLTKLTF